MTNAGKGQSQVLKRQVEVTSWPITLQHRDSDITQEVYSFKQMDHFGMDG